MTVPDAIRVEENREDDTTIVIRAEIPGVDPDEDIDVSLTDGKITIAARREQREETKTEHSFQSEFRTSRTNGPCPYPPTRSQLT